MNIQEVKAERDKVFDELCSWDPNSPEYEKELRHFDTLTKIINEEEAKEFEQQKQKDELALKERKVVLDARSADKATEQKDREGKRGVIKAVIGVIGSLIGIVIAYFCEDILGKIVRSNHAWGLVNKNPKV